LKTNLTRAFVSSRTNNQIKQPYIKTKTRKKNERKKERKETTKLYRW